MTVTVELGEGTVEVRAHDLVQFDEADVHLSIPYEAIRQAHAGPYTPPAGTFTLANRAIAYADVTAGHYRHGDAWTFAAFDDPARTVILDLTDFDFALRPYVRVVLGVDDPAAFVRALNERSAHETSSQSGDANEIAWTALGAGMAVLSSDGTRVGTVTHPLGDIDKDLFEGVAFRTSRGRSHMARPEDIALLSTDAVRLAVDGAAVEDLPQVALEDLREVTPGRGIFRHSAHWTHDRRWNDPPR